MTARRLVNRSDDIAIFYSDDQFSQEQMNHGSGMYFLPAVQDLKFGFDGLTKKNKSIGSRNQSFTYPNQAPDISVDISILENFETLFEDVFTGGNLLHNFDSGKNFYFLISTDEERTALSRYKNSISVGNCFLDSVNISQSINGVLKSDYSYVGSNILAQEYQGTSVTDTSDINFFQPIPSKPRSYKTFIELANKADGSSSRDTQNLTIKVTTLPQNFARYRIVKTVANGNFSFSSSKPLYLGFQTITVPAVGFDRNVRIQFSSDSIEFDFLHVNGQALWPSSDPSLSNRYISSSGLAPSVNSTGDQEPVGNFFFSGINQEISSSNYYGEFTAGRKTFVKVSGVGTDTSFLITPNNVQSFDIALNLNRKRINSVNKFFPMGRKATPPFLGTISLENKFSDIETGDSFINFLKNPEEYHISISGEKFNGKSFMFDIPKAFLQSKNVQGSISSNLSEKANFIFGLDSVSVLTDLTSINLWSRNNGTIWDDNDFIWNTIND
tara:strand:- start:6572 stop:8065 length:1494 start_codon:yes stop_codon:yes gene_type:complete